MTPRKAYYRCKGNSHLIVLKQGRKVLSNKAAKVPKFKTAAKAQAWVAAFNDEEERNNDGVRTLLGDPLGPIPVVTLTAWFRLEILPNKSKDYVTTANGHLGHIDRVLGRCDVRKLWDNDVSKLATDLIDQDYAYSTIKHVIGMLRYAINMSLRDPNFPLENHPCHHMMKPALETMRARGLKPNQVTIPKREDMHQIDAFLRFLHDCNRQVWALLWLQLNTGMRVGEATDLTLDRVDLKRGVARVFGKTNYSHPRDVALAPHVVEFLRNWIAEERVRVGPSMTHVVHHGRRNRSSKWKRGAFAPFKDGSGASQQLTGMKKKCEDAGVPWFNSHSMRHAYISLMLDSGANFKWISAQCGTGEELVLKRYGHLMQGMHDVDQSALAEISSPLDRGQLASDSQTVVSLRRPSKKKAAPSKARARARR